MIPRWMPRPAARRGRRRDVEVDGDVVLAQKLDRCPGRRAMSILCSEQQAVRAPEAGRVVAPMPSSGTFGKWKGG